MTQLHLAIWEDFCEQINPDATERNFPENLVEGGFEGFCKILFVNWSSTRPSFRLTSTGLLILCRMYQFWEFDISKQPFNTFNIPKVHIHLYRSVKSPYHYDQKRFIVFHSERAMELEMAGGNILTWAEMFG